MPIKQYTNDQSVTAEAAAIMHEAYDAVLATIATQDIKGASTSVIAWKIASAVFDGESDAARIVKSILCGFASK